MGSTTLLNSRHATLTHVVETSLKQVVNRIEQNVLQLQKIKGVAY